MFSIFSKKAKQATMPYTTDLHSHILPGIDDGSQNVETSLKLVDQMQQWGITKIVTTPHVTEETFENTQETIKAAYNELKTHLSNDAPEIIFSAEYRMDENFMKHLKNNTLIPLPNNYLLIENSFVQPFWDLKNLIFELQLKGFKPILAHPERYTYYYEQKRIYTDLIHLGCLFQINWLSIAGYYGKDTKAIAHWMIDNGYVDFMGTDLHNMHHAEAITEYLNSKDYQKVIRKLNLKNELL